MGKGNIVNKSWYGDGRKYKKYHGSNIKEPKVKPSDMDNIKKDIFYSQIEY